MGRTQRPGRPDLLRLLVRLLLLLGEVLQLRDEIRLLQARLRELVRELLAERRVRRRDRAHLVGVRLVLALLALPLARAGPEDEAADERDRDGEQADEPRERGEPGRRAHRRPPAASPAARLLEPR